MLNYVSLFCKTLINTTNHSISTSIYEIDISKYKHPLNCYDYKYIQIEGVTKNYIDIIIEHFNWEPDIGKKHPIFLSQIPMMMEYEGNYMIYYFPNVVGNKGSCSLSYINEIGPIENILPEQSLCVSHTISFRDNKRKKIYQIWVLNDSFNKNFDENSKIHTFIRASFLVLSKVIEIKDLLLIGQNEYQLLCLKEYLRNYRGDSLKSNNLFSKNVILSDIFQLINHFQNEKYENGSVNIGFLFTSSYDNFQTKYSRAILCNSLMINMS